MFDNTTELVSYNFYSEAGNSTGQNSKGETVSNNCGVNATNMPEWTLPATLAAGDYRMRFNVAWNSIDPCGYANMAEEGGAMVDVIIRIASQAAARTISVSVNPAETGTVTINGEEVHSPFWTVSPPCPPLGHCDIHLCGTVWITNAAGGPVREAPCGLRATGAWPGSPGGAIPDGLLATPRLFPRP